VSGPWAIFLSPAASLQWEAMIEKNRRLKNEGLEGGGTFIFRSEHLVEKVFEKDNPLLTKKGGTKVRRSDYSSGFGVWGGRDLGFKGL